MIKPVLEIFKTHVYQFWYDTERKRRHWNWDEPVCPKEGDLKDSKGRSKFKSFRESMGVAKSQYKNLKRLTKMPNDRISYPDASKIYLADEK